MNSHYGYTSKLCTRWIDLEAILHFLHSDPNDLQPLSPSHFLTGRMYYADGSKITRCSNNRLWETIFCKPGAGISESDFRVNYFLDAPGRIPNSEIFAWETWLYWKSIGNRANNAIICVCCSSSTRSLIGCPYQIEEFWETVDQILQSYD